MKVAIVGGGFSGIACAHELERLGVRPVLYEKNPFIGDPIDHVTAILEVIDRPVRDAVEYFKSSMNIEVKPLNQLKTAVHKSPNVTSTVRGNLGYFFKNTNDRDSVKVQMLEQLKHTDIRLNSEVDPDSLCGSYDYVVVATGSYSDAYAKGLWQEWFRAYVRGALVYGDFDPQTLTMWLNKDYFKNGYAYLAPFNRKKAALVSIVTDVDKDEVEHYWELFMDGENLKYGIAEGFKLEHRAGFVYPHVLGNSIFVGNAGGVLDPFLGFGVFSSVCTGVAAARAIAGGGDFEKLIGRIVAKAKDMRQFRRLYDTLTNKGYDNMVKMIGIPAFNYLIYNVPLKVNLVRIGAAASRLLYREGRPK